MNAMRTGRKRHYGFFGGAGMLIYLALGPIIWALHLTLVYGAHTLLCARGIASGAQGPWVATAIVVVATVVALGLLVVATRRLWKNPRRRGPAAGALSFYDAVMLLLLLLSAVAVIWAGATSLIVSPCAALR
jgi:hypothetical protein